MVADGSSALAYRPVRRCGSAGTAVAFEAAAIKDSKQAGSIGPNARGWAVVWAVYRSICIPPVFRPCAPTHTLNRCSVPPTVTHAGTGCPRRQLSSISRRSMRCPGRDTHPLSRRISSPRGLDALQNRKAQEYNCTHCDPTRGHMQYRGSID